MCDKIANGEVISQDDFPKIEAAAKNFALNQDIYIELNFFAEFGEVLGKHPKLWKIKLQQEVSKLTELKAHKRRANLRTYISRDGAKLKKLKPGPEKTKFAQKLEQFELELELLEKHFNL